VFFLRPLGLKIKKAQIEIQAVAKIQYPIKSLLILLQLVGQGYGQKKIYETLSKKIARLF